MLEIPRIDYKSIEQFQPVSFDLGFVISDSENRINAYSDQNSNKYSVLVRTTNGSEIEVKPASNSFLQIPLYGEHVLIFKGYRNTSNFTQRRFEWYYWPLYPIQNEINENSLPEAFGPKRFDDETKPSSDDVKLGNKFQPESVPGIQPFEGDTLLQGRFGNVIRLGSSETPFWSGTNGSPIIILSNSTKRNSTTYRVENVDLDASSLWLTTTQKINSLDLSKSLSGRTSVRNFNKSQLIGSADRIILQSKTDSVIIDSNQDIVMLSNRIHLGGDQAPIPMTHTLNLVSILQRLISALTQGGIDSASGAPVALVGLPQIQSLLRDLESLKIDRYRMSV